MQRFRITGGARVLTFAAAAITLATCVDRPHVSPGAAATASAGYGPGAAAPAVQARVRALLARFPRQLGPASDAPLEASPGGGVRARLGAAGGGSALRVELPADAAGPVRLRDERSGLAVGVALEGAAHQALQIASGYPVYAGAAPQGGDIVHRLDARGDEDYVSFAVEPARKSLRYVLDVSAIPGLRLVDDMLEALDARGTPRLRVAPPLVVDATGRALRAALAVEGCAVDRDPRAPWGRAVTAPGAPSCVMAVSWPETGVRYPALVDPAWQMTTGMVVERWGHTMAPLASLAAPPSGVARQLIAGGVDGHGVVLASVEVFEPLSQTFTLTSPMGRGRVGHTATAIPGSATGQILIAGTAGQVLAGTVPEHLAVTSAANSASTEIYDEVAGTFSAGPAMTVPRFSHTATALLDGRILLAGGTTDTAAAPTTSADLFAPGAAASPGTIAAAHTPLNVARFGHAAALLPTGAVLISGGINASGTASASAETFCPLNACVAFGADDDFIFASTAMTAPRAFHTATTLASGDVLIAGGASSYGVGATYLAAGELFSAGAFQGAPIPMARARAFHTATALAPPFVLPLGAGSGLGEVLVVGGFDGLADLASVEAFFPGAAPSFAAAAPTAVSRRRAAAARVAAAGGAGESVLVAGGVSGSNSAGGPFTNGAPTPSAELFIKVIGDACAADGECVSGHCVDGVCCDGACDAQCVSCAAALKQSGADSGTCGPSLQGRALPVVCVPGLDVELHSVCDGAGNAVVSPTLSVDCKPYACGPAGRCATSCDQGATPCAAGASCLVASDPDGGVPDGGAPPSGVCRPLGLPGMTCAADGECLSNICADSVCCDARCDGPCTACMLPGHVGTCTVVPDGQDPRRECAPTSGGATACSGVCQAGQCAFPGATVSCGTCASCDGAGRCTQVPDDDAACGTIDCSGLNTACRAYPDVTSGRCAALGACKPANAPATCTQYTERPCDAGTPPLDGPPPLSDAGTPPGADAAAPAADAAGAGSDATCSAPKSGGCRADPQARPAAIAGALLLGLALVGRRRRRP